MNAFLKDIDILCVYDGMGAGRMEDVKTEEKPFGAL